MKRHEQRRLTASTVARTRQVSGVLWDIPQVHIDRELELEARRASGFHDPIRLRGTNTGGYDGILEEGYDDSGR